MMSRIHSLRSRSLWLALACATVAGAATVFAIVRVGQAQPAAAALARPFASVVTITAHDDGFDAPDTSSPA